MQYKFRSQFPSTTVGTHRFSNHCCTVNTQAEADDLCANRYFGTEFWRDDPYEVDPSASSQSSDETPTTSDAGKTDSGSEEGNQDESAFEEDNRKSGKQKKSGKR